MNPRKREKAVTVSCKKKKRPARRWGQGAGQQTCPRFAAGLPFPVPEVMNLKALCGSGNYFPAFFPGLSRNFPREPPKRSRKQPQQDRVVGESKIEQTRSAFGGVRNKNSIFCGTLRFSPPSDLLSSFFQESQIDP